MRSYSTVLLHKNRHYTILGDLDKKCETLAATRSALWEKYESADATKPGVVPHYTLRAVGKLAIWPPMVFDIRNINLGLLLHKSTRSLVCQTKSTKN